MAWPTKAQRGRATRYRGSYPVQSLAGDGWMREAACAPQNAGDEWDPRRHTDPSRVAEAKEMCSACPVMAMCADFAMRQRITEGVWGGLDLAAHEVPPLVEGSSEIGPGEGGRAA